MKLRRRFCESKSSKAEKLRRKIRIAQGARPSRDGAYKGMCVPQDASDGEVIGEFNKQETAQEILQLTRRASTEERSVQRYMSTAGCEQQHSQMENPQAENPVTIARRSHLFPSRTQ